MTANGFICKEDWEQLVYGGGKYELIFRSNVRIKQNPLLAAQAARGAGGSGSAGGGEQTPVLPRFAGGRRTVYTE